MFGDLRFVAAGGLALMVCLAGCRRDGLIEIGGVVTYAGQPVKKGSITFLSPNGEGPTAAAVIENGKYVVRVAPGAKQVKIEGCKVIGQRPFDARYPGSPMVDILGQILPERYNTKSELTREIVAGTRTYDFRLEK